MDPVLADERDRAEFPGPARDPLTRLWLAVFLLATAMLVWLGFQTFQLARERSTLETIKVNQETTIAQAQRVRGQLDSIARRTLELAQQGNAGAAAIVEQLARRGVAINPSAPATPSPGQGPAPAPSK